MSIVKISNYYKYIYNKIFAFLISCRGKENNNFLLYNF